MLPKRKKPATETKKTIKIEQCVEAALYGLGMHMTESLIGDLGDPKLIGFKDSAERCLQKVTDFRKKCLRLLILALVSAGLSILAYHADWSFPVIGTICGLIAVILGLITMAYGQVINRHYRVGKTARMMAKAWRPFRKIAMKEWIVEDIASTISYRVKDDSYHALREYQYSGKEMDEIISRTLDSKLREHAKLVKDAEMEGINNERRKHRKSFNSIHKFSEAIGFEPKDWGHYFDKM